MPNWCNNTVEIYHEDPAMLERVRSAFKEGTLLNEFIPVPKELKDTVAGQLGQGYANDLNKAKMELNVKYFGHKDWYDWCLDNWGTKWDVGGDGYEAQDITNGLMLSFESAWSPPIAAYDRLMEQGFELRAMYHEPGMAFAGIWDNGHDEYYEYSEWDSKEIADQLPEVLDEAFGISESVAECEELLGLEEK